MNTAEIPPANRGDHRKMRPLHRWWGDTLRLYPNETGVKIVRKYVVVTGLGKGYLQCLCPDQAEEILAWRYGVLERRLNDPKYLI